MKKTPLLNQPISNVIAGLGHTDKLVIADAGLPIPPETTRIDLALTAGIPRFLETLKVVLSEMQVERVIIADEMCTISPELHRQLLDVLGNIPLETVTHVVFKEMCHSTRAVIRTGEFTPYANIILVSGVVF